MAAWVLDDDGAGSRELFAARDVTLGEFRCTPGSARWTSENCIGDGHHIVFPLAGTVVGIAQERFDPVVATANHAIFYDAGTRFRRELVGASGDHCLFLIVEAAVLAEATGGAPDAFRFAFACGPASARVYLLQRAVATYVLGDGPADPLAVHESLLHVIERVLDDAYAARGAPRARRERTRRAHGDLVEGAKAVVAARHAATLQEVADAVHVSPFHLARTFRELTGYSIRSYRNQLRLRAALEGILDGERLADVASRTGFASHSHLTERFTRSFGIAPSAVRRAGLSRLAAN